MKKIILSLIPLFILQTIFAIDCNNLLNSSKNNNEKIQSTIDSLKKTISSSNSKFDWEEKNCLYRQLAFHYSLLNYYDLSIDILSEFISNGQTNKLSTSYALSLVELGNYYKLNNQYDYALENYLKANEILQKNGALELFCVTQTILAEFYRKIGDYTQAQIYLNKVIKLYELNKFTNEYTLYKALTRKAAVYNETNKLDSSILTSRKVIEYSKKHKVTDLLAIAHNEIGYSYLNKNMPDSSLYYYKISENQWLSINDLENVAHTKYNIASCVARNFKDDTTAINLLNEVKKFVNDNALDYSLHEVYLYLSTEYKRIQNYDSALKYTDLFYGQLRLNDARISNEKVFQVQVLYENNKLNSEKLKIANELDQTKFENKKKDFQLRSILIFSIFAIISIVIISFLFIKLKKNQTILKIKNDEKDVLLKEIQHRVKNNMQMVSSILALQSGKSEDEISKETLKKAIERINALTLAHQKIYINGNYSNIFMLDYINQICENLLKNLNINYSLNISSELELDIEKAQAIGFIINELITNSIKYAWINLNKDKQIIIEFNGNALKGQIIYKDNGKGFDVNQDVQETNTLGFNLIKSFVVRQLKGDISFGSDEGLTIFINYNL